MIKIIKRKSKLNDFVRQIKANNEKDCELKKIGASDLQTRMIALSRRYLQ